MTAGAESGIVAVYVLFGSGEEARRIGRDMVERRLAACVNILAPCHSIYRWQGAIEEAAEVPAFFKTTAAGADALARAVRLAHGYEVPAIGIFPVSTDDAYRNWVGESVEVI
jgi:periplasmic divalent cation tolerance protein